VRSDLSGRQLQSSVDVLLGALSRKSYVLTESLACITPHRNFRCVALASARAETIWSWLVLRHNFEMTSWLVVESFMTLKGLLHFVLRIDY
jgi:hypothetical protein